MTDDPSLEYGKENKHYNTFSQPNKRYEDEELYDATYDKTVAINRAYLNLSDDITDTNQVSITEEVNENYAHSANPKTKREQLYYNPTI